MSNRPLIFCVKKIWRKRISLHWIIDLGDRLIGWHRANVFRSNKSTSNPGPSCHCKAITTGQNDWIVVAGTAQVYVDDQISLISEGQSIYVPLGAKHRLENPGKVPVILIEVQTGRYLEEDDIIRYDDVYARA